MEIERLIGAEQAKRTKAAADIQAISESLQMFKLDNGFYPSGPDGLDLLVNPFGRAPNPKPDGYLAKPPVDPWGKPYAYFTDGRRFLVKSYGSDGREGGDGSAADILSDDV